MTEQVLGGNFGDENGEAKGVGISAVPEMDPALRSVLFV